MEFTTIQHRDTREIIQHWIDGKRVPQRKYRSERDHQLNSLKRQYTSAFTDRTRQGNFRHTFYTSNSVY